MSYLVQESDGTSKITLEDGSGFLLLDLNPTGQTTFSVGDMIAMASDTLGSFIAVDSDTIGNFIAVDSDTIGDFKVIVDG